MELKDKICVAPHQIFDYDLDIQDVGHNGAEEYIRKDALLEWLENKVSLSYGIATDALVEVIDKLNSL